MKQKLPELFELIIEFDNARPYRYETVVPISAHEELKAWRTRRAELSAAAANFVKKQRGSGGSGASG